MKILHITNWYPTSDQSQDAIFIQNHFKCAQKISESDIVHIEVRKGSLNIKSSLSVRSSERQLLLFIPSNSYFLKELLTFLLVFYVLIRLKVKGKRYDLYAFHIAHPLLIKIGIIKLLLNKAPMVIFEHWTAYSKNFNFTKNTLGRKRIANIFHHSVPVVAVSDALMNDIVLFSGTDSFDKYIIPNVIFSKNFYSKRKNQSKDYKNTITFFMLARWSSPNKRPELAVKAFCESCKKYDFLELRIGGIGGQLNDIKDIVSGYPSSNNKVSLLGDLDTEKIAHEMRNANVFIHPTERETFSVVCAEALFCDTPVIVSNVPPLPTFINEQNGILVENTVEEWKQALTSFIREPDKFSDNDISANARTRFGEEAVASKMKIVFEQIIKSGQS